MAYTPLRDYALIGDCRTAALVSRDGAIDWLCLPAFDSDSLFAALLDAHRGGRFHITGRNLVNTKRRYRDATAILETEFICQDGVFRLTDCLVTGDIGELRPQRELLRRIEILQGRPKIHVCFDPRPDYARQRAKLKQRGKLGWIFNNKSTHYHLQADIDLALKDGSLQAVFAGMENHSYFLSLSCTTRDMHIIPPLGAEAEKRLRQTQEFWQGWTGQCTYRGPYHDPILRSLITLKCLNASLSGAVLAAPTSSLPEQAGGEKNWDYRFCWLRDAEQTLTAFAYLGYVSEAQGFFNWLMHTTRLTRPRLQVLYDLYGRTHIGEWHADYLEGYRNAKPVRFGNDAWNQRQLDIYGEVILAAYGYCRAGEQLEKGEAKTLRGFADFIADNWHKPDHSIWESRGEPQHFTYSKIMCWAGLERMARLVDNGVVHGPASAYKETVQQIAAFIEEKIWNQSRNAYTTAAGNECLDAGVVRMAQLGLIAPDDARMRATFRALEDNLHAGDGLYYRFENQPGRPAEEGAFLMTSLWVIDYLIGCGRAQEAQMRFESVLQQGNDLGLFSEEIEAESGAFLGNFPQAYTHSALIHTALSLQQQQETGS